MCLTPETESLWTLRESSVCPGFWCSWKEREQLLLPSFLPSLIRQPGQKTCSCLSTKRQSPGQPSFLSWGARASSLVWAILWEPQSTQEFRYRALLTKSTQAGSRPSWKAALLSFLVTQEREGRKGNRKTLIRKKKKSGKGQCWNNAII